METMTPPLLDRELVNEIKRLEQMTGRDMLSVFVRRLEEQLAGFEAAFSASGARAAHSLKGASRQLGASALGGLFADIELAAKSGDYAEAKRKFDGGADLIAQSLEALKRA